MCSLYTVLQMFLRSNFSDYLGHCLVQYFDPSISIFVLPNLDLVLSEK